MKRMYQPRPENKPRGEKPILTGQVQTKGDYKPVGKISLWLNHREGENQPRYVGELQTDKATYKVSLWEQKEERQGADI